MTNPVHSIDEAERKAEELRALISGAVSDAQTAELPTVAESLMHYWHRVDEIAFKLGTLKGVAADQMEAKAKEQP